MEKILKRLFYNRGKILIFIFIFFAYLANAFHTQFPDEFDNIYGGFLINHGKLPYIGFFTHHNPGAYFLASIITLFSRRSFVLFRIIFAFVLFFSYILSYFLLKKKLTRCSMDFFLLYGLFIAIGATYWWGQMLLSETIVGFLLVPAFILIFGKKLSQIKINNKDLWIISLLTFFSLFVSLTYIYLIPIFDLIVVYFFLKDNPPFKVINIIKALIVFAFPYLLFFIYLIITGSFQEFYFQSIYYNVAYYIYNFPKVGDTISHHPFRYGISIAKNTIDNIIVLLAQIKDFNLSYPFNVSLSIANFAFLIFLIVKRQIALTLLYLAIVIYTNARSEPLNIKETDFHATVYIMLTISSVSYLFFGIKDELNKKISYFDRLIFSFILIITSFYWFFTFLHLSNKFIDKAYGKFMGRDPLIYDRPQVAPVLNKILSKNDYFWIGPFELQELLFIEAKVASKNYWFLPANSRDEKIKREIISDLTKNKPKVIVFKKWWANFGVKPEDFNTVIVDFLDKNYFQLKDLNEKELIYRSKMGRERDFDFETELFFDNNRKEEIVRELLEKGLIEKI